MDDAAQIKRFVPSQHLAFQAMAKPVGAACDSVIFMIAARRRSW